MTFEDRPERGHDNNEAAVDVQAGDIQAVRQADERLVDPTTYHFTFAWEDLLTEKARETMIVYAGHKKGMWVVEPGQLKATFLPYEQAMNRAEKLGLEKTVKRLNSGDQKVYNPAKEAIVLFPEPIEIPVGSPLEIKKVRTLAISRGKNTVLRTEID